MSQFEDNLWEKVVDRHGDDLASGGDPQAPRGRGPRAPRPRLVAGGTLVMAAAAAAATVLVGASANPQPAFAVTRSHDGQVLVRVDRVSGVAGANRRLAALGVGRRLTGVTHGRTVSMGWALPDSGCWMYEPGKPPVTVQLSAAQQQADIHDGIFTPPSSSAGNTGGPPQNGPWHVVYCRTSVSGGATTGADQSWALPSSGCWMYEDGKWPVTVGLSAAQQRADIHDGIFTPPSSSAGNTGGPPQNGPWHVIYCQTDSGGS